ncbi:MAG: hypothetical protein IT458_08845 [Planctomycetes bacterium]|nr:hypothetical protein [Planctomycetota bacterium]
MTLRAAAALAAFLVLPACQGTGGAESAGTAGPGLADGTFYAQASRDGRIYVFGKEATFASWQRGGEMQLTRALIGAGPGGETVVFEVDAKDAKGVMTARLMGEFAKRNNVRI